MKRIFAAASIFLVSCGGMTHANNQAAQVKMDGDSACGPATASELNHKYLLTSEAKPQGKFTLTIQDQDGNKEKIDEGEILLRKAALEDEVDVTMRGTYSGARGYDMSTWSYTEQGVGASGSVNYKMEQTTWLVKLSEPNWLSDVLPLFTFQVAKIAATSCGLSATSEPTEVKGKSYTLTVEAQF